MALQFIQAGGNVFHTGVSSDSWSFHAQTLFLAYHWFPQGGEDTLLMLAVDLHIVPVSW